MAQFRFAVEMAWQAVFYVMADPFCNKQKKTFNMPASFEQNVKAVSEYGGDYVMMIWQRHAHTMFVEIEIIFRHK